MGGRGWLKANLHTFQLRKRLYLLLFVSSAHYNSQVFITLFLRIHAPTFPLHSNMGDWVKEVKVLRSIDWYLENSHWV